MIDLPWREAMKFKRILRFYVHPSLKCFKFYFAMKNLCPWIFFCFFCINILIYSRSIEEDCVHLQNLRTARLLLFFCFIPFTVFKSFPPEHSTWTFTDILLPSPPLSFPLSSFSLLSHPSILSWSFQVFGGQKMKNIDKERSLATVEIDVQTSDEQQWKSEAGDSLLEEQRLWSSTISRMNCSLFSVTTF